MKELKEAVRRYERAAVLQEETALLREERLEHAEIEHGRILLHLAEVRVDRRGQRRRRADADADIQPDAAAEIGAAALDLRRPTADIGDPFDAPRRIERRVENEMTPSRYDPLLSARTGRPVAGLVQSLNRAAEAEAPDLAGARRRDEPHLRKRDAVFGDPSFIGEGRPHLPHALVIAVGGGVVVEREVR